MAHQIKIGVTICTPMPFVRKPNGSMGMQHLTVEWHRYRMSLQMGTNIQFYEVAIDGMEVGEARDKAVEQSQKQNAEFLLFIDSDVLVPFDAFKKLLKRAREWPDYDIFSGIYCTKDTNPEPLIYRRDGEGPFWDWTVGDLVRDVSSVGMGCCLIRMSLFDRLEWSEDEPLFLTTSNVKASNDGLKRNYGTEDIYFCRRAREEAGAKILVDTSVLCGHQDLESGVTYGLPHDSLPYKRAKWMPGHPENPAEDEEKKVGLEIGPGASPQGEHFPDYEWFTLDARADVGADYVQDLRGLNLPDDQFDLLFSSHTLEHIGRWDQEKVWSEMFRVTKPGGKLEIYVPNIKWAANHIVDGVINEHVMNVLYGAQESHGYARELNTHYFGFTPDIAKELAESVGYENVEVRTYIDDPGLRYNIHLTAEKPSTQGAPVSIEDRLS